LDLDLSPGKAQVYEDAPRVGEAGNFDGLPDSWWLEKGAHRLSLYKDGYLTVGQEFTIHLGVLREVKFRLASSQSVPPHELVAQLGVGGR